jgi:predicted ATPase/DNA-binding SARP family transcriptional activator
VINTVWHIELFNGFRAMRLDSEGSNSAEQGQIVIEGFRSQKTTALLAYLALHRHNHRREWLAELFWPDSDIQKARNSLRVAIHDLRKSLEGENEIGKIVVTTRDTLHLTKLISCDVLSFQDLACKATTTDDEQLLEKAFSLVKGPLLRGFYEEWISSVSAQVEEELLKVASRLIQIKENRGDVLGALAIARRASTAAPTRMGIMRELVRLGIASNEKESVKQEYEAWRRSIIRLGDNKVPDWNSLVQTLTTPTVVVAKPVTNSLNSFHAEFQPRALPRTSGHFFGRTEELSKLLAFFSDSPASNSIHEARNHSNTMRLATLTGIGGIGKSRLALEAAHRLQQDFGAVLWVSAGNLPSISLLPGAIMDAAGANGPETLENVVSTLESLVVSPEKNPFSDGTPVPNNRNRVLLVLDNCEQLSESISAFLNRLQQKMPSLCAMATSLGPLRLSYEQTFTIGPLQQQTAELFAERARLAKPNFLLTKENKEIISQLTERLNGLPLAIEIAAARMALFTPQQMLQELSQPASYSANSFLDWENANRDVPGRHRSLRQTIEWSARQLTPAALNFWSKLSVFPAPFTLDAAASICRESQAPALALTLRDCSLLSIDLNHEIPRGVWIESLRQFAASRLSSEQKRLLQLAHAQYFLHLAENLAFQLEGPKPFKALARIDLERTHFRVAIEYFLTHQEGESEEERDEKIECALRICAALSWYWEQSGHISEGYKAIEATLEQAVNALPLHNLPKYDIAPLSNLDRDTGKSIDPQSPIIRALRLRARVIQSAGKLANHMSDHETAAGHIEQALQLFHLIGDYAGAATCLYALGFGALQRGEIDTARALCEQSVALTRKLNAPAALGDALYNLALVAVFSGDFENVKKISKECLDIHRSLGDRRGIAIALENLGLAGLLEGAPDIAETYYLEATTSFEALGEGASVARCVWGLGHVERLKGNNAKARNLFRKAMMLSKESQNLWAVPFVIEAFGYLATTEGNFTRATQLLSGAAYIRELQGEPLPSPQLRSEFEQTCAILRENLGEDLFEAHWQTGRILEREDLIEMATVQVD